MRNPGIYKWSDKLTNQVNSKRKFDKYKNQRYKYDSQKIIGDVPDYDFDGDYDLFGWYDIQCGDR